MLFPWDRASTTTRNIVRGYAIFLRSKGDTFKRLIIVGGALSVVGIGVIVYDIVAMSNGGRSLFPHYLAAPGLVMLGAGLVRRHRVREAEEEDRQRW
jgi:hypothetical protein